jgi:hypothetical protein
VGIDIDECLSELKLEITAKTGFTGLQMLTKVSII